MEIKYKSAIGVISIFFVLLLLTPFADPNPDGLESAAEQNNASEGSSFDFGFLTDYGAYGSIIHQVFNNEALSTFISGLIGVFIIVILFFALFYIVKQRRIRKITSENT
ncbi:MAG: PDGLE domain-containing protein [Candidatus Heimdallarchaeota archaeon]|nr:MAG: PDGLE domain-containing protein [Candidatus Heimdallarchaeota archaeon]